MGLLSSAALYMMAFTMLLCAILAWQAMEDHPLPKAPPGEYAFDPRDMQALLDAGEKLDDLHRLVAGYAAIAMESLRAEPKPSESEPKPPETVMVKPRFSLRYREVSVFDQMKPQQQEYTRNMEWFTRLFAGIKEYPPALLEGFAFLEEEKELDRIMNYLIVALDVEKARSRSPGAYHAAEQNHAEALDYLYHFDSDKSVPLRLVTELGISSNHAEALQRALLGTLNPPPPGRPFAERLMGEKKKRVIINNDDTATFPIPVHVIMATEGGGGDVDELQYIHSAMRHKHLIGVLDSVLQDGGRNYHPFAGACGGQSLFLVQEKLRGTVGKKNALMLPHAGLVFGFMDKPVVNPMTSQITRDAKVVVPVLAVRVGASAEAVAQCTDAVLHGLPMFDVRSISLMGAGGVSPLLGSGWPAPGSSSDSDSDTHRYWKQVELEAAMEAGLSGEVAQLGQATVSPVELYNTSKVALGSVCVTHAAAVLPCGECRERAVRSASGIADCSVGEEEGEGEGTPCGLYTATHQASLFAESIKAGMAVKKESNNLFPPAPSTVVDVMRQYWREQEAIPEYVPAFSEAAGASGGGGVQYEFNRDPPVLPRLLNCVEADPGVGEMLGGQADAACRARTLDLMNAELKSHFGGSEEEERAGPSGGGRGKRRREPEVPQWPAERLACMQAAGAYGLFLALQQDPQERVRRLPAAVVRGASHYTIGPLHRRRVNTETETETDGEKAIVWEQDRLYAEEMREGGISRESYRYAIQTASSVLLHYFTGARSTLPPNEWR